jgi:hypothetical protein
MESTLNPITATTAIEQILNGKPLRDLHVKGTLVLQTGDERLRYELILENCIFDDFKTSFLSFERPVRISRCVFYKCSFNSTYFIKGLHIEDSVFKSYLEFIAGGHNQNGSLISIANCTFEGFVNFFDCWYKSQVDISNNNFRKGTNLMGNRTEPYRVQFDTPLIIENNTGQTDIDGEGDKDIKTTDKKQSQ